MRGSGARVRRYTHFGQYLTVGPVGTAVARKAARLR